MKYLYKIILFSLFLYTNSIAQNNALKFDKISLSEGLSQTSVSTIIQDNKGFLWFGTLDGLNKYDGYKITVYRHKNGNANSISDNSISVIYEDFQTNLWIGTRSEGLCKYNKLKDNFTTLKHDAKDSKSLISNKITCLYEDKERTLWIGTENGLSQLKDGQIRNFVSGMKANCLISNTIKSITGDALGNILIGTDNGLCLLSRKEKNKAIPNFITFKLPNNTINTLLIDRNLNLWIGTENGLNEVRLFDLLRHQPTFTTFYHSSNDEFSLSDNSISALLEDDLGDLWIGSHKGGLNRLVRNSKTVTFIRYQNDATDKSSLSADNVLSLLQDKSRAIWVGTSLGGVNKWDKAVEELTAYRHNPFRSNCLNTNQVRCIYQDKKGMFWIGTVDGGLNQWNEKNNTYHYYKHEDNNTKSLSDNHIRTILEDSKGRFWIGTDNGGLNLFNPKTNTVKHYIHNPIDNQSISNNSVWKIIEDSNGVLWIATFGGGLNRFDAERGTFIAYRHDSSKSLSISDDNVTTLFEDNEKKLWVGTFGGGLNEMNRNNGTFISYQYNEKDKNSIGNNRIYSIMEDKSGMIWIGTKGCLNKLDKKTQKFVRIDESIGLPNDVIMGILEDKQQNLWISTNKGISKFNPKTMAVRNYDIGDGLQSNEFLVGSAFKSKDGKMFFGGIDGFNAFYPENIKDNPHIPEVVLTRFQVFNQDMDLDTSIIYKKQITLKYYQNVFSFDFVALNFVFPEKNQYSYQMQGFDKQWNKVGNRRFASYTNLPAGKYVFRVKASNNAGIWNEKGIYISIIITPPFWKTTWFYVLVFISVISGIYGYIKLRERNLKNENIRLERIVTERTAEIKHQKEKIEKQRDFVEQQNVEILQQKHEIEVQRDIADEHRKNLTENIQYASHIQEAILPPEDFFAKLFPEHFVLYRPKDIVSGDYYWMAQKGNKIYFVVADCTGHGVSGAFMSMLGVSFLNAIMYKHVDSHNEIPLSAGQILDELRENVKQSLHKTGKENEAQGRVGMDIGLCIYDTQTMMMQYAGAYCPLYIVRKGGEELELISYKADKMPIGFFFKEKPFTNNEFQIQKGDTVYLFSDGYIDQFGGDKKRRFLVKNFTNIMLEINEKSMTEQCEIIEHNFDEWRGEYEQVDDVLVMGIRIV